MSVTQQLKDKVEFSLDNRQIFFLFFGLSVVGCFVFAMGVMVGKRGELHELPGVAQAESSVLADDPQVAEADYNFSFKDGLQRVATDGLPATRDPSVAPRDEDTVKAERDAALGSKSLKKAGSSKKLPANDLACARLMADIHLLATYAQETAVKVFEPTSPFVEPLTRLSTREREVLNWVKEGKSAWVIGEILGISEHTVEFHCTNARRKMGAATTHAAILRAIGLGLL